MARKDAAPEDAPRPSRFRRRRKGQGDGPRKPGRIAQLRSVYTMTRAADPSVLWWMLLAGLGILAVGLTLGLLTGHPIYATVLALPMALLVPMIVLARKAERAAYAQIEGQPGAVGAALGSIRRGFTVQTEPVAVDPRTQDLVYRAVGRPGVVLVSEGPPQRVKRLVEQERKRVLRVVPGVPVHVLSAGPEDGQVPVRKLASKVTRLKPQLTKHEAAEVAKRLKALGGVRPPVPKGIDPLRARPDRRMTRGR